MAKYRALASLYVGSRLLSPGDVFQSDDVPGTKWEALDDEGRSAQETRDGKEAAKPAAAKPDPNKSAADKRALHHPATEKKGD